MGPNDVAAALLAILQPSTQIDMSANLDKALPTLAGASPSLPQALPSPVATAATPTAADGAAVSPPRQTTLLNPTQRVCCPRSTPLCFFVLLGVGVPPSCGTPRLQCQQAAADVASLCCIAKKRLHM